MLVQAREFFWTHRSKFARDVFRIFGAELEAHGGADFPENRAPEIVGDLRQRLVAQYQTKLVLAGFRKEGAHRSLRGEGRKFVDVQKERPARGFWNVLARECCEE